MERQPSIGLSENNCFYDETPAGGVQVPINKLELSAPWISLASLITVAAASVVYVERINKQQN